MPIDIGDKLKDNDPRTGGSRVLTVTARGLVTEMGLQSVRARQHPGSPEVSIATRRIHSDGKSRRSGFDLLRTERPAIAGWVGQDVMLVRGACGLGDGSGPERRVRAQAG